MASAVIAEALLLSDTELHDLEKKKYRIQQGMKKKKVIHFQKVNYEPFLN